MDAQSARLNQSALDQIGLVLGGYKPGYNLVEGHHQDACERFVLIRSRGGMPRLLLPPKMPLMRKAVMGFLGGKPLGNVLPPIVQMAAWLGGPLSSVSSNLSLKSQSGEISPLRELMSTVLNRNDFHIALRASFGRPNAKSVAMAISDSGEVLCYAKLGAEAMTDDLVAHEAAVLKRFEGRKTPVIMPRPIFSGEWANGHNVLIIEPLPLAQLKPDASIAHSASEAFSAMNLDVQCDLKKSAYWLRVTDFARKYDKEDFLPTIRDIENVWGEVEFDFCASHGDWTRANLGSVDGGLAALDWERFNESAPKGIDIAHFALNEQKAGFFRKSIDLNQTVNSVRTYLQSASIPVKNTEPLILLALLEMVIRFKSASAMGLKSRDSKFGPAFQEGIKQWVRREHSQ